MPIRSYHVRLLDELMEFRSTDKAVCNHTVPLMSVRTEYFGNRYFFSNSPR